MKWRSTCGTLTTAYAVAASWRPASTIAIVAFAGTSGGVTSVQVLPSSVIWTMPLLVPAHMTPGLTDEGANVKIAARFCAGVLRARVASP